MSPNRLNIGGGSELLKSIVVLAAIWGLSLAFYSTVHYVAKRYAPRPGRIVRGPVKLQHLTIIAVSEVHGTPEPCGCQSDPLGDVARLASLLDSAKGRGAALLVDAGGLSFSDQPLRPMEKPQALLKAEFLERTWGRLGAAVGIGEEDFRLPLQVPRRRIAANVTLPSEHKIEVSPSEIRDIGGVKVGLTAVLDPAKAPAGVTTTPMLAALIREVASLRQQGAQVVVVLAHTGRATARRLVSAVPGISILVAGDGVEEGAQAEQVNETILVQPAKEGQRAVQVALRIVADEVSTTLFTGPEERSARLAKLNQQLEEADQQIAKLSEDRDVDLYFLSTRRERRRDLAIERERLVASSADPPVGSYAEAVLVPIRRTLQRHAETAEIMKRLDGEIGETNRAAGEKIPVPPAARGEASYVGLAACESCHSATVKQWRMTVHARAWKELVDVNKQWSFDCIKCHVTGYGQPGGSAMAHVEGLTDVQCESCHGPGSLHANAPKRSSMRMPNLSDCRGCHSKEHSDTFDLIPYLRDVLGPGHGERQRDALGPGITGRELRHSAQQRAKTSTMGAH